MLHHSWSESIGPWHDYIPFGHDPSICVQWGCCASVPMECGRQYQSSSYNNNRGWDFYKEPLSTSVDLHVETRDEHHLKDRCNGHLDWIFTASFDSTAPQNSTIELILGASECREW